MWSATNPSGIARFCLISLKPGCDCTKRLLRSGEFVLILANYPTRDGRQANGVGPDTLKPVVLRFSKRYTGLAILQDCRKLGMN